MAEVFRLTQKEKLMIGNDSSIEYYKRYRSADKKLNRKMLNTLMTKEICMIAADALGIKKRNQLILESEDEIAMLMDFVLYELLIDGTNLVTRYANEVGRRSKPEQDLLAAMSTACTGLFKVTDILPTTCQLKLKEIADPKRQLTLTDIHLSQTVKKGLILFFRPLELKDLVMTSGIGFPFPATMKTKLLREWKDEDMAQRFVKCYHLSKRSGISISYA